MQGNPSLGFVLGDEGSGSSLGKKLIRAFHYNLLPADLHESLLKTYPKLNIERTIERVYQSPAPNRWLAGFVPFIAGHIKHPFVYGSIEQAFSEFYNNRLSVIPGFDKDVIHFVGGVAFAMEQVIRELGIKYGITVGKIIESPLEILASRAGASLGAGQ